MLIDEQCAELRKMPGTFNDMLRAAYAAGMRRAAEICVNEKYATVSSELSERHNDTCDDCSMAILSGIEEQNTPPGSQG